MNLLSREQPRGIDVSNNNGLFDWAPWKGHIDFAMAKASEGTGFTDPDFPRNWAEMSRLGIYRFAYHYGHPSEDPVKQAEKFLNTLDNHGGIRKDDNFVLDFEEDDNMPAIKTAFWAWVCAHTINKYCPGHRTIVYTYPSFAQDGHCAMVGSHPLWIADYDVPTPEIPPPWKTARFWQYAGGKPGGVDLDVFLGTHHQLKEFCEN
jgi:lysozyme